MDTESSLPPTPPAATRRRGLALGAALGAAALVASILGVTTIAGAQDDPATGPVIESTIDDADTGVDAGEAEPLPDFDDNIDWDDVDPAWVAFDECIETALADIDWDSVDENDDTDWAAIDARYEQAEADCKDLLPDDVKAEWEAWEPFDQCLTDAGFGPAASMETGPVVYVETGDGGQTIEFGDTPGSVTITGDADGVSVSTEGGVRVVDEAEIDAAFEACEALLPDDFDDDDFDNAAAG